VVRFSSDDSDVRNRPRSGQPCTATSLRNEERIDQFIRANPQIKTWQLCTELKVRFDVLEKMLETLESLCQVDPRTQV
jgi:hypothetical protein